ncbi:membrane protein [Mycolicibacterium doricum]|nr:membrane protein [Mycolicibacterium doricum]
MLPVYQREAMWLSFSASEPAALQIGVGKVCAVSGLPWIDHLVGDPQNYVALPQQPWLDGINSGDGFIRQFVAVPLGSGATVEGQVTGEETHGGVQLRAVALTEQALAAWYATQALQVMCCEDLADGGPLPAPSGSSMGLGAGGRMRQEVYADDRPLADYDEDGARRVFVHLCSAAQWTAITGEVPPSTSVDRDAYVEAGLPWFDYYDADAQDLAPSKILSNVKSVGKKLGTKEDPFVPIDPKTVVTIGGVSPDVVADGEW